MYGKPLDERAPGQGAQTAKTALQVGGASVAATGAVAGALIGSAIFPGVGTAVGAVVGTVAGLLGTGLSIAAMFISPERAAARTALMQQGLSKAYADEYYKYSLKSDDELVVRAGQLYDKAVKGKPGAMDGLAAIRTIRAERGAALSQQQAAILAVQPRSGTVPVWAPVAFIAIIAVGLITAYSRRRG
jgi:hypothetical protein